MANPTTLQRLDANQVLQAVYDDNLQALRTNVEATVVASGAQEVEVSAASGDNIAIASQDGSNTAAVSAAGAIRVDPTLDGGATASNQVAELGALISIDSKLSNPMPTLDNIVTSGTTTQVNGTANTTPANVPSVDGNNIASILIDNRSPSVELLVSFDGGSNFKTLRTSSSLSASLYGAIKHVVVKTLAGTADYETIINRE